MAFGSALEELATRNTAGRPWSGVYKAPTTPLYWSVLALSLSSCVTLGFLFRNLPILFCTRVT